LVTDEGRIREQRRLLAYLTAGGSSPQRAQRTLAAVRELQSPDANQRVREGLSQRAVSRQHELLGVIEVAEVASIGSDAIEEVRADLLVQFAAASIWP
jgi:hypothetical protein